MATLTEHQVVEKVQCPTCGQGRGYWCKTSAGKTSQRLHATRHRKAGSGWGHGKGQTLRKGSKG